MRLSVETVRSYLKTTKTNCTSAAAPKRLFATMPTARPFHNIVLLSVNFSIFSYYLS